jgi:hypothetical protein
MVKTEQKSQKRKKEQDIFLFIVRTLRKDAFMITIILLACILCVYCAYYSMSYDLKIQTYYKNYTEHNCYDMKGDLVFTRPSPFTIPALKSEVLYNGTKSKNKNS